MEHRAVLRLGFAPVLLLSFNMAMDGTLPFLGPMLVVPLLAAGPPKPKMLAGAWVLIVGISAALTFMLSALASSPASVWLLLLALAAMCFARLERQPGNLPAFLALITGALVTALIQASPAIALKLPGLMSTAVLQAAITVLIAYAVLPSPPVVMTPPPRSPPSQASALRAMGKAVALVAVLALGVTLDDTSAVLVTTVTVNVLQDPQDDVGHRRGVALIIANAAAVAAAMPTVLMAMHRDSFLILTLLALASGLILASGVKATGTRRAITEIGMPAYLVLIGTMVPQAGDAALAGLMDRLFTAGMAVGYGLAVLILLRWSRAWLAERRA